MEPLPHTSYFFLPYWVSLPFCYEIFLFFLIYLLFIPMTKQHHVLRLVHFLQKNISFFSVTLFCNYFILATDFMKPFVFTNSTTLTVTDQGTEELFRRHNRQTEWLHLICNSFLKLNRLWGLAHSNPFVRHKKFILSFLQTVTPCCQWGPANFKTRDFHL